MRIISPCSKLALRNFMLPCEIMLRISNIRNILKLCTESSASLTRGLSNFGYVQVCIEMYLAKDVLPFPSVNVSFHCFCKQRIARNFKLKFLSENESSTLTIFHRLNREFIYWNLRVMSIPQTISIHLRSLFASRRSRIFFRTCRLTTDCTVRSIDSLILLLIMYKYTLEGFKVVQRIHRN